MSIRNKWKSSTALSLGSRENAALKSTSASSSSVSKDPVKALRMRIATLLLRNQLNLLAALCQSTFVGDAAAAVANSIIGLLKQMRDGVPDIFVRRILKTKIVIYVSKGRKMADILRDNSMSTMILTSYARMLGTQFLTDTLENQLKDIIKYIGDSNASENSDGPSEDANKKMLEAALLLLNAIIENKAKMPRQFRQICRFVKLEVHNVISNPPPKRLSRSTIDSDELSRSTIDSDESPSKRSSIVGNITRRKLSNLIHAPLNPNSIDELEESQESTAQTSQEDNVEKIGHPVMMSAPAIPLGKVDEESRSSQATPKDTSLDIQAHESKHALAQAIVSQLNGDGLLPSPTEEKERAELEDLADDDNALTMPERMVGTIIFLRFFVPAITAPENHGMLQGKINNAIRKGLINVGKVLNGFCSEADFKQKDPNWGIVNEFIVEHRPKVKNLISSITDDETLDRAYVTKKLGEEVDIKDVLSEDTYFARELDENLSLAKISDNNIEIDEHLLIYLAKSVHRMEKDMKSLLKLIPEEEGLGVMDAFYELKTELDTYNQLITQPVKGPTFFSKIGKRFNTIRMSYSSAFFNSPKSKSSDDVSHIAKTQDIAVAEERRGGGSTDTTTSQIVPNITAKHGKSAHNRLSAATYEPTG
ncbi:hypothetical protein MP638_006198 [Amoeboaphelidium occidentale]|nr:hypothetical protein MP638_006198 [Amoeboaphelidium occidentale]